MLFQQLLPVCWRLPVYSTQGLFDVLTISITTSLGTCIDAIGSHSSGLSQSAPIRAQQAQDMPLQTMSCLVAKADWKCMTCQLQTGSQPDSGRDGMLHDINTYVWHIGCTTYKVSACIIIHCVLGYRRNTSTVCDRRHHNRIQNTLCLHSHKLDTFLTTAQDQDCDVWDIEKTHYLTIEALVTLPGVL